MQLPSLQAEELTSQGAIAVAARPPLAAAFSASSTSPVEQSLASRQSAGGLRCPLWCVMVCAAPWVQSTTSTSVANEGPSLVLPASHGR